MTNVNLTLLLPTLAVAAQRDWNTRQIPNALVMSLAIAGLVAQVWASGSRGPELAASGALVGALCLLPIYLLRGMAAGDVKLMAATGAWLNPELAAYAVTATYLMGSLLGAAFWLSGRREQGVPYALAIALGTGIALCMAQLGAVASAASIPEFSPTTGVSP